MLHIIAAVPVGPSTSAGGDASFLETLRTIWEFQLFTVQGSAITVWMLVIGVMLFLVGFVTARVLSASLARRVVMRMGATEGGAAAVQALTFYTLLVLSAVFALNFVGVPLTAFTVLGGALAIGVGFGSQNIVNNFISGLILHIERPVKSGDVIEISGTEGVVEHIGARSTRVITADNTHIIVPNSSFLEQNVQNWSYNDKTVRLAVKVGIAYGSPTREAETLLLQAGGEHKDVQKKPAPMVRFDDFGASSLDFTLQVWTLARAPGDIRKIRSDLRYRIDELFREHGITIAFPQSDVHLDVEAPVRVQVVGAGS